MAADEISIEVNGKRFGGWTRASVTRSIEAVCGSFDLTVTDRWEAEQKAWPIRDNDECRVRVGDDVVLTGYVFVRRRSFNKDTRSISIVGRDAAADLVDCSAKLDQWEFKGVSVQKFAEKICAPFGISVSLQSGLALPTSPDKLTINPGDTAFHALERACRIAGVLLISDGRGGIVLTRAGTTRAGSFVEGENMLAGDSAFDFSNRHRHYYVYGSHRGSDEFMGEQASAVLGSAEDPNVARAARVLIVRAEHGVTQEHAKTRAQWEATTRAARGDTVSAVVQGWRDGNGNLWQPNTLAAVKSPALAVDGTLLISTVTYEVDRESGKTTSVAFAPPDAFKPEPQVQNAHNYWKEIERGV